jgi:isocitrate dehydrogenase kinase/phosphatase
MMNTLAHAIAKTIINGFNRHIFLFSSVTQQAQQRFEQALWHQVQQAAKDRTDFYDLRVSETLATLKHDFSVSQFDADLWLTVKQVYIELLANHPQADLAETFYNSVFCHLFSRKYYQNHYIFVRTATEQYHALHNAKIYTSYHPAQHGLYNTIEQILLKPGFKRGFSNLSRDINALIKAFSLQAKKTRYRLEQLQFDMLDPVFYRNKGAYLIGRVHSPAGITPFIVAILNNEKTGLFIDALITDPDAMAIVFGFARAYFFVDCQHPFAIVNFLHQLMPHKTQAELYSAIGFHKQGKTQFYRDFLTHLAQSDDKFVLAPGIKGMVMSVFTLPSYPYVFKVIKDKFSPSKRLTKAQVKQKYHLVKCHDRVGRMADTMEYSEVAFPKDRFDEELLNELLNVAPSIIRFEQDLLVIKHLYIERRMTPLNLYLANATQQQIEQALYGYGEAIKQLMAANIFPGDMLLKNFGVTRHGRVIFYDYDEISYMSEINFRYKPEPMTEEQIYAAEPWYTVEPGDMFPEELATFALANPVYRAAFCQHHQDLLDAGYWQQCQKKLAEGHIEHVFPYPDTKRFLLEDY